MIGPALWAGPPCDCRRLWEWSSVCPTLPASLHSRREREVSQPPAPLEAPMPTMSVNYAGGEEFPCDTQCRQGGRLIVRSSRDARSPPLQRLLPITSHY